MGSGKGERDNTQLLRKYHYCTERQFRVLGSERKSPLPRVHLEQDLEQQQGWGGNLKEAMKCTLNITKLIKSNSKQN